MIAHLKASFVFIVIALAALVHADEREVHGRVVDEAGQPVAGADVADSWSGNGKRLHDDGTPLEPTKNKDDVRLLWQQLGQMEPFSAEYTTKTDAQGSFTLKMGHGHTLLAMDAARQRCGLGTLVKGQEEQPLEIRLGPLVHVRGTMQCSQTNLLPAWCIADLSTLDDPTRPLDNTRLALCGTVEGRFELVLPPGQYELHAYGNSLENGTIDARAVPSPKLDLRADKPEVDLGTVKLLPYLLPRDRVEKAKANGTCFDYQKHYGQQFPPWHITEARGINKDVTISNFKGKWVLLTFWGLSCSYCLGDELPRLMKFYEDHKTQRDQFEIISICIDYDGELKTLAEVDHELEPIVKNVWDGKTLPFPILFDPSFKTWETFGIDGLGTTILINPEGKMIEGDEKTLAENLK